MDGRMDGQAPPSLFVRCNCQSLEKYPMSSWTLGKAGGMAKRGGEKQPPTVKPHLALEFHTASSSWIIILEALKGCSLFSVGYVSHPANCCSEGVIY